MVDTFPQISDPVSVLTPRGERAGTERPARHRRFQARTAPAVPDPPAEERLDPEVIKRDAATAGLVLRREETFLRYQYFLVFGK